MLAACEWPEQLEHAIIMATIGVAYVLERRLVQAERRRRRPGDQP